MSGVRKTVCLVVLLLLSSLSGCLGGDDSEEKSSDDILSEIDSDSDGVLNTMDQCPDTTEENATFVDSKGCYDPSSWADDDNDGVMNNQDLCPNTQDGEPVFLNGCSLEQLDQDNDGVIDVNDECPDSNPEVPTLPNGCQEQYTGDEIVTLVEGQYFRNYFNSKPNDPIMLGFNTGNGEDRYAINNGPFATQDGYQLIIGTVHDSGFVSPYDSNKLMIHFSGLDSIGSVPEYISSLPEADGGFGGLFYNSSIGENHLDLALEYYIWAVPLGSSQDTFAVPNYEVGINTEPCKQPPKDEFEISNPEGVIHDATFYDFSGKVVIVEIGAKWCSQCTIVLENLNNLKIEMESNGIDDGILEILAFTIEDGSRSPASMDDAIQRQTQLSLQYSVGAFEEFGNEYINISNYVPTMMVLAPYPANNQGLVIVGFGKYHEVKDMFDSKAKIEALHNGDYALEICQQDDTDGDGTPDVFDLDIDGDGVNNNHDDLPYDRNESIDWDQDGIGNNADTDDDGDGTPDNIDECPETQILFAYSNSIFYENGCADIDGDGYNETIDCDDTEGTVFSDRDGDRWCDEYEEFPDDPTEAFDSDGDGVGDFSDRFPDDRTEWNDTDLDGLGDNGDECPNDAAENPPDDTWPEDGEIWTWGADGCPDNDDDGTHLGMDCDDNDPERHAEAMEVEDGIDNDCNGYVDEGFLNPYVANLTITPGPSIYYDQTAYCQFDVVSPSGYEVEIEIRVFTDENELFEDYFDGIGNQSVAFMPSPQGTYEQNVEPGITKNLNVTCFVTISDSYWTESMFESNTTRWVKGYPPVVTGATINGPDRGWFYCSSVGYSGESQDNVTKTTKWYEDGVEIVGENGYSIHNTSINESATTLSCSIIFHDIDGHSPTVIASFDLTEID